MNWVQVKVRFAVRSQNTVRRAKAKPAGFLGAARLHKFESALRGDSRAGRSVETINAVTLRTLTPVGATAHVDAGVRPPVQRPVITARKSKQAL